MREQEVIVIGAGPAGLSAAIEVAKAGGKVLIIDENEKAGGQLFKQIHKFFGSVENEAGKRGFNIADKLIKEAEQCGVEIMTNTPVYGIYPQNIVVCGPNKGPVKHIKSQKIIIATGANENSICFEGSTLPGVMTAGAAQTMMNIHKVLPGQKVVVVGSGNVGMIVSYQLLQAGADVMCIVESAPQIGGYGVYASKLRRAGVPICVSHTVNKCFGTKNVENVEIIEVDNKGNKIEGTEKITEADTVCLAVGLSPMTELAYLAGCCEIYAPELGGNIPVHNIDMLTSNKDVYVAGDVTGIEEASTAMEEGKIAGIACAESLGYYDNSKSAELKSKVQKRIKYLRGGEYGKQRLEAKERQIKTFAEVSHE